VAAETPRPFERWFAFSLGLLLVGVAGYAGYGLAREGGGALRAVLALGFGLLGADAVVAALRNRRAFLSRIGPLP